MGLCGHRRNPHLGNLQFPEQNGVSNALSCMVRHQSIACAPRLRNRGDLQPGRPQIKTAAAYWRGDFGGADCGVFGLPAVALSKMIVETTVPMTAEMTAGYKALREGAAVLDLSARGKLRVTGEDRARLLHAMSTNHIQQLKPGDGCYAFFLNAQGRILGDANV